MQQMVKDDAQVQFSDNGLHIPAIVKEQLRSK
jgi:hypothetical protein